MRDFRKLIAWQKAHALAVCIHRIADHADFASAPGLRSQLLRAADSVPANIAEGAGKPSELDFARFLEIALGSAREIDNHVTLATALGCIDAPSGASALADIDEVKRILYSLSRCSKPRAVAQVNRGSGAQVFRPRLQGTGTQGGVVYAVHRTRYATPPCSPVFWSRDLNT